MANTNSLTIGNTTLPVANTLAALDDTNIAGTPAEGSVLTMQSGKWAVNTVTNLIGGAPALVGGGLQSANIGKNGVCGLQLNGALPDGTMYAASFIDGDRIELYKAENGQGFTRTAIFTKDDDTGWLLLDNEYIRTRYRRKNGIVFLNWYNCIVTKELPADTAFGQLPEGFRPLLAQTSVFSVYPEGGAADGYLRVGTDGKLSRNANSALAVGKSFMACFSFLVA